MASENPSPGFDPSQWQPPTPQELQVMLPKYQVTSLIGRGGMGAVYLGRQDALDRPVAIKILPPGLEQIDPAYGARFRQEAMSLAKLNHPGIVAVYDFGRTEQGLLYIVMEHVEGTDVARMMEQQGRVRSKDAMAITAHVCDALSYAHARGIIHRDIKPANILIGMNGAVKVADFGLAKAWQSGATSLTMSGHAMGTPDYIAPEALLADGTVDARADVYALGVMLYHMLTGDLPRGVFEPASKKIEGLDPRYDGIIAQSLKCDPAQRYSGVDALRRDLDAIFTTPVIKVDPAAASAPAALNTVPQPRRPSPPSQRPPSRRQPQRKAFDWGFWLPVGSVLIGLVAFFGWRYLPAPERKTIQRIEGEALKVIKATGGETRRQEMGGFLNAIWSGAAQVLWIKGAKNDSLTLQLPVQEAGRQRVKAVFSLSHDFAVVDVALDGKRVAGAPFDLQAEVPTISDILDFGVFDLNQGEHELKITLLDTHARDTVGAGAYVTALDYVQLEPPVSSKPPAAAGTDVALIARPSASHCSGGDHVKHINDGKVIAAPNSGQPQRMTWHPRKGGMEWAQLEWETPQTIDECQIVWFEDKASAMPVFWHLLYREESGAWVPVEATFPPAMRDTWCVVKFPAVKTSALRISAQCKEGWAAGICHWKALAADPTATTAPAAKRDLLLTELSPLHAQSGWGLYRANNYGAIDERDGRVVLLSGKACTQYLWAHPMSRTVFAIPDGYTAFTATGIGPSYKNTGRPSSSHGSWKYIIEVDGKTLLESDELNSYFGQEHPISVTFPAGSKRLTLITDNCGNGHSDHAFWAYPTLSSASTSRPLIPDTANPPIVTLRLASDPSKFLGAKPGGDLRVNAEQAASFRLVPGIADSKLVSLELVGSPGFFVRHSWAVARVQKSAGKQDDVFDLDATWRMIQLGDGRVRFEAQNYPGTFMVAEEDGSVAQTKAAPLARSIFLLK